MLTDIEEIKRGIEAGVVEFRQGKPWCGARHPECVELNLESGYEYRVRPGCTLPPKEVLLTDPEEINRGITAGVVDVYCRTKSAWMDPVMQGVESIKSLIELFGAEYRLRPGCTLPPKEGLLTDPEEILRGIMAGVVEVSISNDRWAFPNTRTLQSVKAALKVGCKYRVCPGCTIPPKEVLLTDPEEILRGIKAGVVQVCWCWLKNTWATPTARNLEEVSNALRSGSKYRVLPGCTLPPKEVLLTDPKEILRGIKAGVVQVCRLEEDWVTPKARNLEEVSNALGSGSKYRVLPDCTIPPNEP